MPITQDEYLRQRAAVRGSGNPQQMHVALWEELVRSGETSSAADSRYAPDSPAGRPAGWCFDRYGMTRTRLPDGRIVCIAGEHEDYYDPDFFIYNDVIVIAHDGRVEIYGYRPDVFPPTDFHTATLVGTSIYIIGGLSYQGERGRKETPVYCLDLRLMRIRAVMAGGDSPGWIYRHRAELASDGKSIRVGGGNVITLDGSGKEAQHPCTSVFTFDTVQEQWVTPTGGVVPTLPTAGEWVDLPGWTPLKNANGAKELRDAIAREVGPEHPLFCGDFWPMAEDASLPARIALQMLDGSGRWAICDGPSYGGRQPWPFAVTFYPNLERLTAAAADEGEV